MATPVTLLCGKVILCLYIVFYVVLVRGIVSVIVPRQHDAAAGLRSE